MQRKFIDRKDYEKGYVKTALDLAVKNIEVSHVKKKASQTSAPQATEVKLLNLVNQATSKEEDIRSCVCTFQVL